MIISVPLRRGVTFAALAAAALLAGCGPSRAELEAQAAAASAAAAAAALANAPPPVELNESVAQSASVYVDFIRDIRTIHGGFADAASIQDAIRKGAAYQPEQLSRGMIAYASILALQSPEFVAGVRTYATDRAQRQEVIAQIVKDPAYAAQLPGADAAAGLIIATLGMEIDALNGIADGVEQDAYTIQERGDPRRAWAVVHIADREARLEGAKALTAAPMLPSADVSARLFEAANTGTGLGLTAARRAPPYTPAVVNALAIAALASLGAAGDNARANTDALQIEQSSEFCLNISKLNFFQCLAASRPSYEDMFCVGRHVVRDLASCASGSVKPAPVISISDPVAGPTVSVPIATTTSPASTAPAASTTAALNATAQTPAN